MKIALAVLALAAASVSAQTRVSFPGSIRPMPAASAAAAVRPLSASAASASPAASVAALGAAAASAEPAALERRVDAVIEGRAELAAPEAEVDASAAQPAPAKRLQRYAPGRAYTASLPAPKTAATVRRSPLQIAGRVLAYAYGAALSIFTALSVSLGIISVLAGIAYGSILSLLVGAAFLALASQSLDIMHEIGRYLKGH